MAQTDYQEKQIGDHWYRVGMLDPLTAQDLWIDIMKALGPALAAATKDVKDVESISDLLDGGKGIEALGGALGVLTQHLSAAQMRTLCSELSKNSFYSKDQSSWPRLDQSFNVHFRGRLDEMYGWLWFALGVNYGPLFKGIGRVTDLAGRFSAPRSPDPTPSTSTDTP